MKSDLAEVLQQLYGEESGIVEVIHIETTRRLESLVYLDAYGGLGKPPFAAARKFYKLGCGSSYLRAFYDGGNCVAVAPGGKNRLEHGGTRDRHKTAPDVVNCG